MNRTLLHRTLALSALCLMVAAPARAGILEDDEARRAILELRTQNEAQEKKLADILARLEKLEAAARGQLTLAADLDRNRGELQKLRGDLEVTVNELVQTQRRSKDLYSDLDGRLKKFEPQPVMVDGKTVTVDREESAQYEQAMGVFKGGDFKGALAAFNAFLKRYPDSAYASSVLYFAGTSHYALKDFKSAVVAQQELVRRFPTSARAPDALLNIASSQLEQKDLKGAKKTLETLADKYSDSPAAATAKERLAALR